MPAIAPSSLKLSWENALSYESALVSQNYYGGIDEKGNRNQLNQVTRTQTLSLIVTTVQDYTEIDNFLTENLCKPIYFDNILYYCESFKWVYQNDKIFNLDLSLVEVFRP